MKQDTHKAIKTGTQDTDCSSAATSAYHSVVGYREILGIAQSITMANTKILTLELMQATDAAAAGAKALGAAVTKTAGATGGAAQMVAAQVEDMDVAGGFTFVALKVTGDEAVPASSTIILMDGRFS